MRDNLIAADSPADAFWSQLDACDHCVQFYESDQVFLDALEAFVAGGLRQGDAIIVIGTAAHRDALEARLECRGFDLAAAGARDQFIAMDAAATLQTLLVNDWPDEARFNQLVAELLGRARRNHRKVRVFGEMVALMWAAGLAEATISLEQLWNRLCAQESFSLFCAFPKTGFTEDVGEALDKICAAHSKVYVL